MFGFKSKRRKENEAAQKRYADFVQQSGELFEDKQEPLSQEDIQDIERRKKKLDKRCIIGLVAAFSLATIFLIMDPTPDFLEEGGFVAFWLFVIGGLRFITYRNFNKALNSNMKRVLQGVITAKIYKDYEYYFGISNRIEIQVRKRDYKNTSAGDILRIEMFSEDVFMDRKIAKLGKI